MDQYELSMLQSFIDSGMVNKKATFEVFTRKLQPGFRYGVFAGTGRLLPMIENLQFSGAERRFLREAGIVNRATLDWLDAFKFSGTIDAYQEGDLYFPNSPVLTVSGTLGECLILETLVLSVLNHDSAIASKASRMVSAAKDRPIIEMGSRRTHEDSAIAAARAAYIAGFSATSNLAAGMEFGIPTTGTAAHAFTLAHDTELEAFRSQVMTHGAGTSLLVDTYDTETGIENALAAVDDLSKGEEIPGAIRIDSGDLAAEAYRARAQLDASGAHGTKILVTSDLDEHVIKDLLYQGAPIDGFGVGTKLVSTPPAGFVYKLVEIEDTRISPEDFLLNETYMRPVAKKSADKVSVGGRKTAYRCQTPSGDLTEFYRTGVTARDLYGSNERVQQLQYRVMENGKLMQLPTLEETRRFTAKAFSSLPFSEQAVWSGTEFGPYITAEHRG